ncbi:glucuronate isomerase [Alkalicoccobacillus plakortidis]|uniref:Uronate isomerase n=1 Tax=Alkalicoccobacillus plakortidis TaxID=444060 RepID=A0ABT0XMP7_9BACI|nr:glucuronate isomerase [Alkalicoccobacillus plakortidis]MCM2677176.1 glucuronate isomerase [Alkalicoccobacillus plakortidis]
MITTGKAFIHDDFLLTNEPAKRLYHEYAKDQPILDYHCHVSPHEIAGDRRYNNIAEVWLHGDHYKWRGMRALGIDESYITGEKSDKDKFLKWASAVPHTIGNPLYHWTHLELKRYFGVDELLNEQSAERIWTQANERLQDADMSTRGIINQSNVNVICTTDDPIDSLESHKKLAAENGDFKTNVYPAFRPDKVLAVKTDTFIGYVEKLAAASDLDIRTYSDLLKALEKRADVFHEAGCRLSDHGIETIPFKEVTQAEAEAVFEKALNGSSITPEEELSYQAYTMQFLGRLYHKLDWTMQLHLGAARNNNTRMFNQLGADTGFDSMGDAPMAQSLNGFLNELERTDELPKSIIYTVNPIYNEVIASAIGNFQSSGARGKIQFGSGWWFNDQKDGMIKQLKDLSNIGLLSTFVGMLTDSRSFLSYTRHEYFRRVLCDLVGSWIAAGEAPDDYEWIGAMIENICYNNAERYFEFA